MAKIARELALTDEQLDELMTTTWNMRVATVGPGDRINVTPLWFGWGGGNVYFYCRGQKITNLRRSPTATVLVDRNERFPELQGVMLQGQARVLEDADAEAAAPHLEDVRWQMGTKYAGGHGEAAPPAGERVRNGASARGRGWGAGGFPPLHAARWEKQRVRRASRR